MNDQMMSIEQEVQHLINFLSHPAGFDAGMAGILCIRPTDENSPPTHWAVDWQDIEGEQIYWNEKEFSSLPEAVQFFVEKRRYLCYGLDFEAVYWSVEEVSVEVVDE